MLENCLSICSGKGGVGKTSLAANLAGLAALAEWKVLLVDLDNQGDLGRDLGYKNTDDDDRGEALVNTATTGAELVPCECRPGLFVVPGGRELQRLKRHIQDARSGDHSELDTIEQMLAPLEARELYDLIVLDLPPSWDEIVESALCASRWLIMPTKADDSSIDGLEVLAHQLTDIRTRRHTDVSLLGVVLFGIAQSATAIRDETRQQLEAELAATGAVVFGDVIRSAEAVAVQLRRWGVLAHEYELEMASGRRGGVRYQNAGPKLAADYAAIADQALMLIADRMVPSA